MKKHLSYFILIIFTACGSNAVKPVPDGILKKEELIPVIVDLQVIESHYQRNFARVDLYRDALDSSSATIFANRGITKEIYVASIRYYAEDPDTLYTIYEAALDTINFRLTSLH